MMINVAADTWDWDPSLYSGSATYYTRGRLAYPEALVDALATALRLDGSGRLLDVGCGPGSLTLPLAGLFEQAIGLDADRDMIDEAGRLAAHAGSTTARWLHMRAEDLPARLGTFRLVTFAQSFHWMNRARVATAVRGMLDAEGACAHVHATTGRSSLPSGTATGEAEIYRAAGFTGPRRVEIPGRVVTRVTDDIVAAVFSLSSSTPHLFGDHRAEFEDELRQLLRSASPSGMFNEQTREIAIDIWRP